MIKKIHAKKLLGSSRDQGKVFNKMYTVDSISFRLGELEKIHKVDHLDIWKNTLAQISDLKKSLISYQSKEGLTLSGKQFDNKLVVISSGEIQRELYEIYLEGIWEIIQEENA